MAEVPGTSSETITETVQTSTPTQQQQQEGRSLTIKLRKRKTEKKVEWSSDTVDNEHLGRRSSKCCCIYEKPRQFGESSSESEGDDDEGCGSANCIMGHGRRGHGQRGEGQGSGPPNSRGSPTH
ncbi:Protein phosphatase 1 regulatory subunit 11 [Oryzias melastigma]|uniref:E3 ubiquitin-protein ligase PPP1R11 n=1 Tax=Oryzias melastigma TaxID=30732 RepID=A0A3B3DAP5_ORYME|nr:E3 ubiquitin-protein ligase PPP1R11 [Oryzias melastigma]KAF6737837.1 Protein phosphatase 1 regulatory subunit 11 [Oryzias melastigma]